MRARWASWETYSEIGQRLLEAWDGEGSVFVVVRSFEIYQELQRLNGDSVCRWLSASPPSVDDSDDAHSISTITTDFPVPDIEILCLR